MDRTQLLALEHTKFEECRTYWSAAGQAQRAFDDELAMAYWYAGDEAEMERRRISEIILNMAPEVK